MKLGELVDIIGGGTPNRKNESYWNGNINWITVKDFKSNYILSSEETITEKGLKNSATKLIPKGNVIIPTRMALGKVAINLVDVAINQDLKALINKDKSKLDTHYLYYFLKSKSSYIESQGKGATVKGITIDVISNMEIKLPKLPVQKKIVNILTLAQSLIKKRRAQIEALDQLANSLFLKMFGDPIKNPKNWDTVSLEILGDWKSGGTPSRKNKQYFQGKIPWLTAGELNNIYTYSSKEYITEEALKNSSAKLIEKESLLLGMYDTAALKSTINKVECACNQAIAYAKLDDSIVDTIFVYYCIQIGKEYYKRQQRGVRQKNLNLTMIKNLQIICPQIELQKEFANVIENILIQKTQLEKGLKELKSYFNSLMYLAFNGELITEASDSDL